MSCDYVYTVGRSLRGDFEAKTVIAFGFNRRELHVTTSKNGRAITTFATVVQAAEDGRGYSWMMFQDYSKKVGTLPCARATEGAIRAAHVAALAGLAPIEAEARAKYAHEASPLALPAVVADAIAGQGGAS